MPGLQTWHVEATYLAWLDARGLGVDDPLRFFEDAGVGLYDGALFGAPGFLRLNFACPRSRWNRRCSACAPPCRPSLRRDGLSALRNSRRT